MTQEDKELLLKDLCVRLPYGVKVAFFNEDLTYHSKPKTLTGIECINNLNYSSLEDEDGNTTIVEFVKPYLYPLSSMTKEQILAFWKIEFKDNGGFENDWDFPLYPPKVGNHFIIEALDWLNRNHFDYRGLIPKGLAIDVTGLNIY